MSATEIRQYPPIASAFRTDRIFELDCVFSEKDLQWCLREKELGRELAKTYDQGELDEILAAYGEHVRAEDLGFLGAFLGAEMCALAIWRKEDWNQSLWLLDIRVQEYHRRKGVGAALVNALKNRASEAGMRGIQVETQSNNFPAISFYRQHGFKVAGFNDHLYSNRDAEREDVAMFFFWEADDGS